jgi:hypothetical protein
LYSLVRDGAQGRLYEYLQAAHREGPTFPKAPTRDAAARLHEALVGLIIDHLCHPRAVKHAMEAWEQVLALHLK